VGIVHVAFQVMVGCGTLMMAVAAWGALLMVRRRPLEGRRWFLRSTALAAPLGLIALEAGWIVTEVGRQPYIIYGVMKVRDALTPMPGLTTSLLIVCAIYALLGGVVALLLWREVHSPAQPGGAK
jgi:cytochrome d ubiquinol oxidase subunit I